MPISGCGYRRSAGRRRDHWLLEGPMKDTPASPDTPSRDELAALCAVVDGIEKKLLESEEPYRDLFEEAPIGYVKEDLESRFIAANRAALRILGLKPEEVAGTV